MRTGIQPFLVVVPAHAGIQQLFFDVIFFYKFGSIVNFASCSFA